MTPLAARLSNKLVRPKEAGAFWRENLDRLRFDLSGIHCFEITQALPILFEICKAVGSKFPERQGMTVFPSKELLAEWPEERSKMIGQMVFLPAPKTWIEWIHPLAGRIALLLVENKDKTWARVSLFWDDAANEIGSVSLNSDDLYLNGGLKVYPKGMDLSMLDGEQILGALLSHGHMALATINAPKIVGRVQHMPNRGLERRLLKAGIGSFPLHAWTEIKLQISKPIQIDDGEPHEAHLTGTRALHFCRAHLRIKQGRLEYVSSHWRGDPAIGIKRSRYVVTA